MSKVRVCDRCKRVLKCTPSAKVQIDFHYYGILSYYLCEHCKRILVGWLREGENDENKTNTDG